MQIAATGLDPRKTYRLVLAGGYQREDLVAFSADIGGAAIAQTLGSLKQLVAGSQTAAMKLEVRSNESGGELILQQAELPTISSR